MKKRMSGFGVDFMIFRKRLIFKLYRLAQVKEGFVN